MQGNWDGLGYWSNFFAEKGPTAQRDAKQAGYYDCLGDELIPFKGLWAAAAAKVGEETVTAGTEHGGGKLFARLIYTLKDGRFTAGGRYSRVLVPKLAAQFGKAAKVASVVGWAYTDYEGIRAIKACSGKLSWKLGLILRQESRVTVAPFHALIASMVGVFLLYLALSYFGIVTGVELRVSARVPSWLVWTNLCLLPVVCGLAAATSRIWREARLVFFALTLFSIVLAEITYRRLPWPSTVALMVLLIEAYLIIPKWNTWMRRHPGAHGTFPSPFAAKREPNTAKKTRVR